MTERKQPKTVRVGVKEKIIPTIRVTQDYDHNAPEAVHFCWKQDSNHMNWMCFHFITDYLIENDVWFTVTRFQVNECELLIHGREARTMCKIMFPAGDYEPRLHNAANRTKAYAAFGPLDI